MANITYKIEDKTIVLSKKIKGRLKIINSYPNIEAIYLEKKILFGLLGTYWKKLKKQNYE